MRQANCRSGWLMLGFLPVAFASTLFVPTTDLLPVGTGEALACSGGGGPNHVPTPGWLWLKPSLMSNTDLASVPVAPDGFFVIDAEGSDLTVEAAQSSMTVVVTDEAGEPVAGETKLLLDKQPGWYLFGWAASAPLEVGAKLTATLRGGPLGDTPRANVGGAFPLVVVGEATPLSEPDLVFSAWLDFFHGSGDPVNCAAPVGYCGGFVSMPSSATKQAAVEATWRLPQSAAGVAWKPRLEASPSNADAVLPTFFNEFLGLGPDQTFGPIAFPTTAEQYCVTLVVEDLRTHEEKRTELCAKPEPARQSYADSQLGLCEAPPTPELTEAWCLVRDARDTLACAPFFNRVVGGGGTGGGMGPDQDIPGKSSSGTGGSGQGVTDPANQGGFSTAGGSRASSNDVGDDEERGARTSKGCQVGGTGRSTGGGAWLLTVLLAALGASRQRRHRPRHHARHVDGHVGH